MKKLMLLTGLLAFLLFSCDMEHTVHIWVWKETTKATATEHGVETQTCSVCGETSGETRISHYWGTGDGWVVKTPATEEADGSETRTCQIPDCTVTETQVIPKKGYETRKFYAQNWQNNTFYQLDAELLSKGTHCNVWVEKGKGVTKAIADKVKNEYDNNVYNKMINAFGISNDIFNFADELADINSAEDGKLIILLLDIRDDYQVGVNESVVRGYFLWSDLFASEPNSNGRAMIYIDTSPGIPGEAASNMTLAHEMQHLINEVTSQVLRYDGSGYSAMDLWIDEGLSTAAEYICSGSHPQDRWGWYHNNGNGATGSGRIQSTIDKGNNFYVWGNRPENDYAEIDDYATVYLFFQWLRLQSNNGDGIYKDIIGSVNSNYLAVTTAASSRIASSYSNNWGGLLRDWLAANYINSTATSGDSSRYGYKNDATLRNLNKHYITSKDPTPLYPGEGVFSKIDTAYVTANPSKPVDKTYIKYTILTTAPGTTMAVGALLTYNVNTVNNDDGNFPSPEDGTVTGVASISVVDGRFVSPPVVLSGPFWVSGTDVLRRNGSLSLPPAGVTRPSIRVAR